jgi:hypothetical protein
MPEFSGFPFFLKRMSNIVSESQNEFAQNAFGSAQRDSIGQIMNGVMQVLQIVKITIDLDTCRVFGPVET